MARGSGDQLDPGGILYGDIVARDRSVNMLSLSPNPETFKEAERLVIQIRNGEMAETLKLLNRHKEQWDRPALARVFYALAQQCVEDRYPDLGEGEASLQKEMLVFSAREELKKSVMSKRLTTRDLREVFFEARALLESPYNPDGELRRVLHRRIFDRSRNSLEHNKQDRWLDQGLLPLLAVAAAKKQLGVDKLLDLDQATDALVLVASGGRYKAMAPWSEGHKGWVNSPNYVFRFYKTAYGSMSLVAEEGFGYEDAETRIMIAARDRLERQLRVQLGEGRLSGMDDLSKLAREQLAEACVHEMMDRLQKQPAVEVVNIFRPDAGCDKDTRRSWQEVWQSLPKGPDRETAPSNALLSAAREGLRAYHRLGGYASDPGFTPRKNNMTTAFISALSETELV